MRNGVLDYQQDYSGRVLTGPQASIATAELVKEQESRSLWPFDWVYPPKNAKRRMPQGSVVIPAAGTSTILAFTVPTNFSFVLQWVLLPPPATAFVPGSGDLLWSINVDTPSSGAVPLSSSPLADWNNMVIPLGSVSPTFAPCYLPKAEIFQSGQVIRANVTNVAYGSLVPICAMFGGWTVPAVVR